MLTWEEQALVNDIGDKLLELYAERDEAISEGDMDRVHQLQIEIDDAKAERQKIIRSSYAL
jgi:molybdenum-dependent DNA-binding transcriptional regulator ModE